MGEVMGHFPITSLDPPLRSAESTEQDIARGPRCAGRSKERGAGIGHNAFREALGCYALLAVH